MGLDSSGALVVVGGSGEIEGIDIFGLGGSELDSILENSGGVLASVGVVSEFGMDFEAVVTVVILVVKARTAATALGAVS